MIKIVSKNVIKDEKKEDFIKLAKELVEKSRQEQGCLSYGLFQDINNDSVFTFIEEWKDQKAIETHNKSEHFTRIIPLLGEFRVGERELNLYKEV